MKKSIAFGLICWALWSIIAVGSLMLTSGCGGGEGDTHVDIYESPETCVPGQAEACLCPGDDLGIQTCSEDGTSYGACECPEAPSADAGTEASVEEDSGTEPDAEADAEVDAENATLLSIEQHGKGEDSFELGEHDAVVQTVQICTYAKSIEVRHVEFVLQTLSQGAHVEGSLGNRYFTNIRLKEFPDGATVSGPVELSTFTGETTPQRINLSDWFTLPANTCKVYGVYLDIADNEDAPGELVSQKYENQVHAIQGTIAGTDTDVGAQTEYGFGSGKDFTIVSDVIEDCPPYSPQSTLTITEDAHPESKIVVAGNNAQVPMARYKACAEGTEDVTVSKIGVQWGAESGFSAESFLQVGVAHQGTILGVSQFDNNDPYRLVDVELDTSITIAKGDCETIELWAKFAVVKSSMEANGEWDHQPRSGKEVSLRIGKGVPFYGYDAYCNTADYLGKLFVHARGATTGEKIFANEGAAEPNFMTIRKTKPVVTPHQLSYSYLFAGEREVARVQIGSDIVSNIALKQIPFMVEKSAGLVLSNFRLFRGPVMVPSSDYHIVEMSDGSDLKTGATLSQTIVAFPIVSFDTEETVGGTGNIYSLRATLSFTGIGHHIMTHILHSETMVVTGHPVSGLAFMPPETGSPHFWHVESVNGGYSIDTFIWSDLSELPHGTSSEDWTTGHQVENLDHVWTLTN